MSSASLALESPDQIISFQSSRASEDVRIVGLNESLAGLSHVAKLPGTSVGAIPYNGSIRVAALTGQTSALPPAKPANFRATAVSAGRIELSWDNPDDSSLYYEYQYKEAGKTYSEWISLRPSFQTDNRLAGIVRGPYYQSKYVFKIRARRGADIAESSEVSVTPKSTLPAQPESFTTEPQDGQVKLIWGVSRDQVIDHWEYRQKESLFGTYGNWIDIPRGDGPIKNRMSYTVTGLKNRTLYVFEIQAVNASGSASSRYESKVTPVAVPAAPTGVTATAGVQEIVVSWDKLNDVSITHWEFSIDPVPRGLYNDGRYRPLTAGWNRINGEEVTSLGIYHISPKKKYPEEYWLRVRAVNASGDGVASVAVSVTPKPPVPSAPTGLKAVPRDGQVVLSWTDPTYPPDVPVNKWQYRLRHAHASAYGNWNDLQLSDLTMVGTTKSYTVEDLTNGTEYVFQVRVFNESGAGQAATLNQPFRMPIPLSLPVAPTVQTTVGPGRVVLSLSDPSNDPSIEYWQLKFKEHDGEYNRDWIYISKSSHASTASYTFNNNTIGRNTRGYIKNKKYVFKIRAVSSYSRRFIESLTEEQADDAVPFIEVAAEPEWRTHEAPTNFHATVNGGKVRLWWQMNSNYGRAEGIKRFEYNQRTGPSDINDDWVAISSYEGSLSDRMYLDLESLTPGIRYLFRIRAVNEDDRSGKISSVVSAMPISAPLAPANLSATPGRGKVTVTWDNPQNPNIEKWEYQVKEGSDIVIPWRYIPFRGLNPTLNTRLSFTYNGRQQNSGAPYFIRYVKHTFEVRAILKHDSPDFRWARNSYPKWFTPIIGPSAEVSATPLLGEPQAPRRLKAEAKDRSVRLEWRISGYLPEDYEGIKRFEYNQRVGAADTNDEWIAIPSFEGIRNSAMTYDVPNLVNGTQYHFRLRAVNTNDVVGPASETRVVTPVAVPAAPTGVTVTPESSSIKLSWTAPNNPSISHWEYRKEDKKDSGNFGDDTGWIKIPDRSLSGNLISHDVNVGNYNFERIYIFQVRAVNSAGAGSPYTTDPVTPLLPIPWSVGLQAYPKDRQVNLRWSAGSGFGEIKVTGWEYQQREGGGAYGHWIPIDHSDVHTGTHTVTGLANGTLYSFRIRAVNDSPIDEGDGPGKGRASAGVVVTPIAVPTAPTGVAASAGNGEIALSWDSSTPFNPSINYWEYRQREGDNTHNSSWNYISSDATTTAYTVSNLTNGTRYSFQIRARNNSGEGAVSTEVSATPDSTLAAPVSSGNGPRPAPAAPTNVAVTPGDRSVTLNWSHLYDVSVTGWEYRQKKATDTSFGDWTAIYRSNYNTATYTVSGLENSTKYVFQIRAVNGTGKGAASAEVSVALQLPPPAKAHNFRSTLVEGSAELEWSRHGDSTVTSWEYRQKKATDISFGAWTNIPGSDKDTTSYTVSENLDPKTEYVFQVRAVNESGSGVVSDESRLWVLAIPEVTSTPGPAKVVLSWENPNDPHVDYWEYRWKKGAGGPYESWQYLDISVTADTISAAHTRLESDTEYVFQVRARTRTGHVGAASIGVSATPTKRVPYKPSWFIGRSKDGEVELQWAIDAKHANRPSTLAIDRWEYRYKEGSNGNYGSWTTIDGSDKNTSTATVQGLTNGQGYVFQVRAVNEIGNGEPSDESITITPIGRPTKVAPRVSYTRDDYGTGYTVLLTWDSHHGSESLTGWEWRHSANEIGNPESRACDTDKSKQEGWSHLNDRNMRNHYHHVSVDTYYQIRACGVNYDSVAVGYSAGVPSDPVLLDVPDLPDAYFNKFRGSWVGHRKVKLFWDAHDFAGRDVSTHWEYQLKKGSGGQYGQWIKIPGSTAATREHLFEGLDAGVEHFYRIRAATSEAKGRESGEVSATPIAKPAAITSLTAAPGDEKIVFSWDNDPSTDSWYYQQRHCEVDDVECIVGGSDDLWGNWDYKSKTVASRESHEMSCSYPSVCLFRVYAGSVTSFDNDREEEKEIARKVFGQALVHPPEKPQKFGAWRENGQVTLYWEYFDSHNYGLITDWEYRQKEGSDGRYGNWTGLTQNPQNLFTSRRSGYKWDMESVIPDLENGTEYTFQVRAVNDSPIDKGKGPGKGAASDEFRITPMNIPAAPTVTATRIPRQIWLSWPNPDDPSIDGWEYKRNTDSRWNEIDALSPNRQASKAATLSFGPIAADDTSTYVYLVRAENDVGFGEFGKVTVVPVPAAVTVAAAAGDGLIALNWGDPEDDSITVWEYQRKEGSSGQYDAWTAIAGSNADTTSHTITGLTNGTEYSFKVRAVNPSGNGAASSAVSATPIPVPAAPTVAIAAGDAQVTLNWTDPNNDSITGWEYRQKDGSSGQYDAWTAIAGSDVDTTSHTITGLTNGTEYSFKVRAVNPSGSGAASSEVSATPIPVPAAPTVTATAGDAQVALAWSDLGDDSITGWEYHQKDGSSGNYGAWTTIVSSDADTTRHTVTGLTNGTEYFFKVRAVNPTGAGAASSEASATPIPVPATPIVTAAAGAAQIILNWTDPDNDSITRWEYRQKEGAEGNYGTWTPIPDSDKDTTSHTISSLTNGTQYFFKVRAVNSSGNGAASNEASATPIPVPAAPAVAAVAGDAQVTLNWTDSDNDSITGWEYQQKAGSDGSYGNWTAMAGSDADTTSHTITGLTNGTEYFFKVRAVNPSGNGAASNEISATPIPPPAAPTVTTAAGDAQVTLNWTDPDNDSITGWEYQQKEGSGGNYGNWTAMAGSDKDTTSHTISSLTNGTEYFFKVRAVNPSGNGTASNEVSATPIPVPAAVTITAVAGDAQVTLSWTDPDNDSITRWEYQQKGGFSDSYGNWIQIPDSDKDTTSYIVTSLTNGTEYFFKVRAVNPTGNSVASNEVSATPIPVPAAPTVTAAAGDAQVTLSWTDPNNDSIIRWEYQQKAESSGSYGDWTAMAGSDKDTTRHTITGLTNGTEYFFKVRTVNPSGNGAASSEVSATPIPAPATLAVMATAGDTQITLSWTDPNNDSITRWEYQQKAESSGSYGDWTAMAGSDKDTTRHIITGLTNGTEYFFKVRAVNPSGNGSASNEASATPIPVPAAPVVTAAAGDAQITLNWTDPNDDSITRWEYRQKAGSGGSYGNWTPIPSSDADTTSHTITDLTNGMQYFFKVRAVNPSGNGIASSEASATPIPVPDAPAVTVTAGDAQITLNWIGPNDDSIIRWEYQQKAGSSGNYGNWTVMAGSDADTTSHTITGLTNGTEYFFKVRAVNSSGNGAASSEVSAMPIPAPARPAGVQAVPGDGQVELSWRHPRNDSIVRWEYQHQGRSGRFGSWTPIPGSDASTTSHVVTGLTNGTRQTFRLRAVNRAGNGLVSSAVSAKPGAPARPTGFQAVAGDGQILLSWSDPDDAGIQHWEYQQRETDGRFGPWTRIPDSGATTTRYTATGLTNGIRHFFRLRAVNAVGSSQPSRGVRATPGAPARPTGFQAVAGDGQILLSWSDPDDAGIQHWEYQQRETDGRFGPWTRIPDSGATTTRYTATGLTNGIRHFFRLRAVNAVGSSQPSRGVRATPGAPARPTGFQAVAGDGQILLSWSDPDDAGIQHWEYQQRETDGRFGPWTRIPDSGATTTRYTATGLTNGIRHFFRLRAVNAVGSSQPSRGVRATPQAPVEGQSGAVGLEAAAVPMSDTSSMAGAAATASSIGAIALDAVPLAPEDVVATVGDAQITLTWNNPADASITRWEYRQKVGSSGTYDDWTRMPDSDATTTRHIVTGLTNGTLYAFQVRAVNPSGGGAASAAVSATPVAQSVPVDRMHATVLPHVAGVMASQTQDTVARRIAVRAGGPTLSRSIRLGALPAQPVPDEWDQSRRPFEPGPKLSDVLDGASFELPVDPDTPSPSIWGTIERTELSGVETDLSWDGHVWSAHLGLDRMIRPHWLAGLAIAHAKSEVEVTMTDPDGTRLTRWHKTTLTSAHPYVARFWPNGFILWGRVGYGSGTVRIVEADETRHTTGLTQYGLAIGGQGSLLETGAMRLALKGEGSISRVQAEAAEGLAAVTVNTTRLRLAVEGSYDHAWGEQATLTPAVEVGVRHDDGDAGRGTGVEIGAGLTWRNAETGVTAELRTRYLAAHERDRDEWSVSATLRLDLATNGEGTYMSVQSTKGQTGSGLDSLFSTASGQIPSGSGSPAASQWEAEIGHGVGLPGPGLPAVLTPYAGLSMDGAGSDTLRLGTRYRLGDGVALGVEATTPSGMSAVDSIRVNGTLYW